ncbi:hypothetical protein [Enhygromyxa salina]|uniref:hypothetical protein n=1 Tax=Enhygromyxa salina TaxID=215803 RepID=UPI0013FCF74C|nr:hypothetical protein [Enhygromyxa salina]
MVFEDAADESILTDASNLRPPEMTEREYLRLEQEAERDQYRQMWPLVKMASPADLEQLRVRWFITGTGVTVQNPGERHFHIAGRFTSSSKECRVGTAWQYIGPRSSAMILAPEGTCKPDVAELTVVDRQGFYLGSIDVQRPAENEP